jgi:hypothetical protein
MRLVGRREFLGHLRIVSETGLNQIDCSKGEGTPRKLATATQLKFQEKIADFKQATGFQISRRTLRKLMFD